MGTAHLAAFSTDHQLGGERTKGWRLVTIHSNTQKPAATTILNFSFVQFFYFYFIFWFDLILVIKVEC